MEWKIYRALTIVAAFVLCGCFAPKAVDGEKIKISNTLFHESGILDLRGEYQDGAWGIVSMRGKIDGKAIVLSGSAEYWGGSKDIVHRLVIPERIEEVRFDKNVLWKRQELVKAEKSPAAPPAEPVPPVPVIPEKAAAAVVPDNEKSENENSSGKEETEVPAAVDNTVKITRLKAGEEGGCFSLEMRWMPFEEIFWGTLPDKKTQKNTVKHIPAADVSKINKYADLEVLEIKGTVYVPLDLTGLDLPKLKKLVIDNGEVKGLSTVKLPELEEFYLNDTRTVPLGKIALPENMPHLHTVGIQAFAGNFDFNSLAGKPLKKLWINGDCTRFEFLEGMKLEELKFNGFTARNRELDVLKGMPLKKLKLAPLRSLSDWSFLRGLPLTVLDINVTGGTAFSPALLKDMPLEILRLTAGQIDWDKEWGLCRNLPLKELILRGARVPEKFLQSSGIERLALMGCVFYSDRNPAEFFNRLPALRHLAVLRLHQYRQQDRSMRLADFQLDWKKFSGRMLESIFISADNINFLRFFPAVKRVSVWKSTSPEIKMDMLKNREFEILNLPVNVPRIAIPRSINVKNFPVPPDNLTAEW